ncbi:MAG: glycosyltransferase family 2 protein [Planctomycetota bacterium]|jgi:N-acetylglucosaminyl-diphospho-decaprenol L-rhamnosyltransferase|nr:glycosyltransferase family 2 protein [Planctomycetota bacterium]
MTEIDTPLITVLVVNWRSGAMTRGLVDNVRRQRLPEHAAGQGLDFVVLDNASGPEEEEHLAALEADEDVTVIRSKQNSGYASGMNLACEHARGQYVLVSNPDVMLFRGMLTRMIEHMEAHPHCGLVGPKSFLDSHRFFQLPPNEKPSLWSLLSETMARASSCAGECHARGRTRRAIEQWTATTGVPVSQVSGASFLMLRDLANELGPFDTRYPFYFEDADLCLRLHRRGFTTDLCPQAELTHFFNRSAGQDPEAAMSRYEVSRRLFYRARYGALGYWFAHLLLSFTSARSGRGHEFSEIDDLGACEAPPTLDVPGTGGYVAELAVDPGFVFAAGRLDVTRRFQIPDVVWDGLVEAKYYVRFLERRSLKVLRVVCMEKLGAPTPVTAESAAAEIVHA